MEVPMMSHPIGQPSFFYYNPESNNDHRQHGHFSQHPSAGHEDVSILPNHQHYYPTGMMMHHHYHHHQSMMYPQVHQKPLLVSPQPTQQRAGVLASSDQANLAVNTQCGALDTSLDPMTPALSETRSGSSSPPSTCGILPTPMTGTCFGSGILEGVKQGCEGDVKNEILAGGDFTRACSPLLTPGM